MAENQAWYQHLQAHSLKQQILWIFIIKSGVNSIDLLYMFTIPRGLKTKFKESSPDDEINFTISQNRRQF